jgi:hypothetical protein
MGSFLAGVISPTMIAGSRRDQPPQRPQYTLATDPDGMQRSRLNAFDPFAPLTLLRLPVA